MYHAHKPNYRMGELSEESFLVNEMRTVHGRPQFVCIWDEPDLGSPVEGRYTCQDEASDGITADLRMQKSILIRID